MTEVISTSHLHVDEDLLSPASVDRWPQHTLVLYRCLSPPVISILLSAAVSQLQTLLYAGFAWNKVTAVDILAFADDSDRFDLAVLQESLLSLLFASVTPLSEGAKKVREMMVINLLGADESLVGGGPGTSLPQELRLEAVREEVLSTERILWNLVTSQSSVDALIAPSRAGLSACLKHYKRIISRANWRVREPQGQQAAGGGLGGIASSMGRGGVSAPLLSLTEDRTADFMAEEYYASVHLLTLVGKTLSLAYTVLEKRTSNSKQTSSPEQHLSKLTVADLVSHLAPGTRSDLANGYLEALDACHRLWCRRYETLQYTMPPLVVQTQSTDDTGSTRRSGAVPLTWFGQDRPHVPCAAVLKCILTSLPMNINEFFSKALGSSIASRSTVTKLPPCVEITK